MATLIVLIPIDGRQLDRTQDLSQSFPGDANGAGPWPARRQAPHRTEIPDVQLCI
jgi:hypothetical protein